MKSLHVLTLLLVSAAMAAADPFVAKCKVLAVHSDGAVVEVHRVQSTTVVPDNATKSKKNNLRLQIHKGTTPETKAIVATREAFVQGDFIAQGYAESDWFKALVVRHKAHTFTNAQGASRTLPRYAAKKINKLETKKATP